MTDDLLIPISALQHFVYCERQAALIHVERVWSDDGATAAGKLLHERVDTRGKDFRSDLRVERALGLRCERLGLVGRADAVEMHDDGRVVPVETKHGALKRERADRIQLCAQALCLEEMLSIRIDEAALYYAGSHRRVSVHIDAGLRSETERVVADVRRLLAQSRLPAAVFGPKCRRCSLRELCMPAPEAGAASVLSYIASLSAEMEKP